MFMATIWANTTFVLAQDARTQDKKNEKNLHQRLEGRWVRPDGGYILELKGVGGTGELKTMYFNPRPINVGISQWRAEEGNLTVFIELRDINYQGSTYTLTYDPDSDRLKGKYFQAPTGMTYEVEFLRAK
jgi:uncharacterized protein (DUF2147 family)